MITDYTRNNSVLEALRKEMKRVSCCMEVKVERERGLMTTRPAVYENDIKMERKEGNKSILSTCEVRIHKIVHYRIIIMWIRDIGLLPKPSQFDTTHSSLSFWIKNRNYIVDQYFTVSYNASIAIIMRQLYREIVDFEIHLFYFLRGRWNNE